MNLLLEEKINLYDEALEQLRNEMINEGFISDTRDKILKKVQSIVVKQKSKDKKDLELAKKNPKLYKPLETKAKKHIKYLTGKYKNADLTNASTRTSLTNDLKMAIKDVLTIDTTSLGEDIVKSILITLAISMVNTILLTIFTVIVGPYIGMILTAVIVAPFTEELGKNYAIRENFIGTFEITFNIMEFSSYFTRLAAMGFKIGQITLIRLPAILMHYTTGLVQSLISRKDDPDAEKKAYVAGICIHASFNALASIVS